jgi:transposase-like protein
MLAEWAAMLRGRDRIIKAALDSGLSISEVSRLTGLGRPTIYRVVAPERGPASLPGVDPAPAAIFRAPPELAPYLAPGGVHDSEIA